MLLPAHDGHLLALYANTRTRTWTVLRMERGPNCATIDDHGGDLRVIGLDK